MSSRSSSSNSSDNRKSSGKPEKTSPYNLRPRTNGQTKQDKADNEGTSARDRRRTSGSRGNKPRAGGRKRSSSGRSARSSRSRSATRSCSEDHTPTLRNILGMDTDMDPSYNYQAAEGPGTHSNKFSLADTDFYPINYSEKEVRDAFMYQSKSAAPGTGQCSLENVGGLCKTIEVVRKVIRLPLLCPKFFEEFKIRPKRGLIFYGPPGVGKTMTARALVESCNCYTDRKIAFFVRKGSDILNPYLGQSEANLTKLFDAARRLSPSIIFLDEFDALGCHRSQNVNHHAESNVVSTLLALIDGLDDRGLVFVIAATNRLDAIDPAFRRAGRFDVEIPFELPNQEARKDILSKITSSWKVKSSVLDTVAKNTDRYSGADLALVCETAALKALERVNPELVTCDHDDQPFPTVTTSNIQVLLTDFQQALQTIPSSCDRLQGS